MFQSAIDPQKLESLLEINEQLNSQFFDLEGLFSQILQSASRLTGGEASSLLLLDPEGKELEFVVALGSKGDEVKSFRVPKGQGIVGWVAQHNRSIIVDDVASDSRFYSKISKNVGYTTRNILASPLRVKGQCVGVLEILNKIGNDVFTNDDMTWLEIFANQAGLAIQNARNFQAMQEELVILKRELNSKPVKTRILTQNQKMLDLLELCRKYASADSAILIQGENGTGKELFAEYIHNSGPRSSGPLIRVNCAALPEDLLESELFGHVKGAFTDAVSDRVGRFEQAQGGTLFLDEIGTIPLALQSKLLRVIQTRSIERIGSNRAISLDVRIVAATNSDLTREVANGTFRQDLFYRLNVLPIQVPALRERRDDIPLLVEYFLRELAVRFDKPITGLEPEALEILRVQKWPGNIRELQNVLERAVVLTPHLVLTQQDLVLESTGTYESLLDLKQAVLGFKSDLILKAIRLCGGNQTKAAQRLGIQRTYLSKLLKELNIVAIEKGA